MPHETGKEAMGIHEFGMWCITIRWGWITAEPLSGIAHQGVNVNVLDGLTLSFVLAIHAPTPGGLSDMDPVGGPVTGAAKTRGVDEGLGEVDRMGVDALPIVRQPACNRAQ